jgi:membrane dipeptidase
MSASQQTHLAIDMTSPLLRVPRRDYVDLYFTGGWTAVAPTVGGDRTAGETLRLLGQWHGFIRSNPDLLLVRQASDLQKARETGKLGIILHFQGSEPLEDSLDLVDAYKALGVGIIQLAYNVSNRIGDGAEEPNDRGLSQLGKRMIKRMNEANVIVDCAHTGLRTTFDAIAESSKPVILSHANPRSVRNVSRNVPDEELKAIGENGGVVGILGYPPFVSDKPRPDLSDYIRHIDYVVELIGIDHVGIAVDYFRWQVPFVSDAEANRMRDDYVAKGAWDPNSYSPPPYHYPAGFETPDKLPGLIQGLSKRGYSDADLRKILGENWVRVYRQVWGG